MDTLDELLDSLTAESSATQLQSDAVFDGSADQPEAMTEPQNIAGNENTSLKLQVETVANDAGQVCHFETCSPFYHDMASPL